MKNHKIKKKMKKKMKIPTFRNFLYSYHSFIEAYRNRYRAITYSLEGKLFRCNKLWYIVLNSYSIETVPKEIRIK
jgi:hypothetical protein